MWKCVGGSDRESVDCEMMGMDDRFTRLKCAKISCIPCFLRLCNVGFRQRAKSL
jgi:hypothetical protein